MGMRALIREFIREMRASSSGTAPYNTTAKVERIEDDKAWVSIPGGVPETPVDIAGNVNVGDEVEVGIGGGRAWAYGNYTDHPVGRKTAQAIRKIANDAGKRAGAAAEGVSRLEVVTNQQGEEIEAVIVTANGKNRTYHQTTAPTGGEYAVGDVWFDTDDDNKMHRWNGTQWADVTLGDDALDSISADKITAGTIDASQITVSNLDAGNITSGFLAAARIETGSLSISKTDGLQTALDGKASTAAASGDGQLIYISKVSGTASVSKNTTWVSRADDVQNTWTTKRPTYNSSYPVLFVARQNKMVDGTVSCTTPVKDDTTTVIDGGHITTGTIDASVVTVSNIDAGNITSGFLAAARIETGSLSISKTDGLQTALDDAGKVADDFLTTISGQSGICVHDQGDLTNFLNVKSGEVGIYVGGTKVATYGATDASIGEGSGTSSIGLCGNTFHLTGRQVTNAGLSGGVLCLDNDSTYTNKFMVVTTLTQSEESGWFGTTSNIPNQDFGVMMVNKGSSDGGAFSVSARKKNGKMASMSLTPTQFVLGLNGTVSGNTVTSDNELWITTSMMTYSKDFKALGKVGTQYGYDNPVSSSINVHITQNGFLYRTTASSRKIKKEITDIKEEDLAPEKLYDLPIRQFKYRKNRLGEEDMRYETFIPGFIAEEVAEVYPIAADLDSKGEPEDWNVRYVVPPMLALIQRQKQAIDGLTERIETIEGRIM